jgi:hypothetical protein
MSQNTLVIAGSIFVVIYMVGVFVYFMFKQYLRLREKELQAEHAKLDDFRSHLERQLMELNMKFASSDMRWRELNHLVVAGQNERPAIAEDGQKVKSSEFLRSHGIDASKLAVRKDLIFVLTPFQDDLLDEYRTIVEVGQTLGFTVNRGDEKATQGDIFPQLLRLMIEARLIIANISGRNPNVFYELGIAHAMEKTVILVANNKHDIPFDIQAKRIVFYRSNSDLRDALAVTLGRTLAAARP